MIKKFLIAALTLILPLCLNAQNGKMEAMRNIVADSYNFWLYTPSEADMRTEEPDTKFDEVALPENIKTPPPPVIIFLHGASLCGTDLYKVRRYGCLDAISRGRNINAVIIAPQNPGGAWNPKKIMDIVKWVNDNREIDTTRIYAIGMSLGGYGTMDLAGTYPDKIAAAMALCGGCYLKDQTGLGKLPLWIIHGTADRAVPVKCSKEVVENLKENKNDSLLMYDWLKGASHSALAKIFYMEKTYDWLFSHSLEDSTRNINRNTEITLDDLKTAYTGINKNLAHVSEIDTNRNATLPSVYTTSTYSSSHAYYTVRQGDTLGAISKKTHTSVATLCRLNGISTKTILRIGRKIAY